MAVYRIKPAPSALHVACFDTYNEAFAHNKGSGMQCKPVRRYENGRVQWSVATVAQGLKSRPDYVKLPHWVAPAWHKV